MKKIQRLVYVAWRMLKWDWSSLLLFEMIYKMLFLVVITLAQLGFECALNIAGITYLTNQNVFQILRHPLSVLLLVLILLLIIYCTFIETAAVILYCERGVQGQEVKVRGLFAASAKRALSIFKPHNLWIFILLMFILPITGIPFTSGPLSTLKIPGFILEFIQENQVLSFFYGAGILFLLYVVYRWIFCIHEFVLHRCSFKEARQKSVQWMKGRKLKIICVMVIGSILMWAAVLLACAIIILGLILVVKVTSGPDDAMYAFWYQYNDLKRIGILLFAMLKPVLLLGLITSVYYQIQEREVPVHRQRRSIPKKIVMLAEWTAVFVMAVFYTEMTMPYDYSFFETPGIQVVAHRAGAMFAPENTLAALNEAIKSGAQGAEIDVQQTKDGELIVMHDTSFQRTAGVAENVWDVTLKEAKTYDMGSFFSSHFRDERIPTLEEMIKAADKRINLMIELKSSGHEEDLEERTVELIHKYHFEQQCSIASMDYRILQKVKELDPNLKTVYIAALAYGDMAELEAADMISIEATFVNRTMVGLAENYGKKVYAWTVNEESDMKKMRQLNVYGIITDNVYYTDYILKEGERGSFVSKLAEKVLGYSFEQN